jgi:hypothetical protein
LAAGSEAPWARGGRPGPRFYPSAWHGAARARPGWGGPLASSGLAAFGIVFFAATSCAAIVGEPEAAEPEAAEPPLRRRSEIRPSAAS